MLDTYTAEPALLDFPPSAGNPGSAHHATEQSVWSLLVATLDEVDFGMLLLVDTTRVLHTNRAAKRQLDHEHPLQLLGDQLRVRCSRDVAPLRRALEDAAQRGLRRLLPIGHGDQVTSVAVIPLGGQAPGRASAATLVMFGKHRVCEALSVQWFGTAHGLTPAESEVLRHLCCGELPADIAVHQGVAISTVRTQISSIRNKTRARNIRALVAQVAMLPPLASLLPSQ